MNTEKADSLDKLSQSLEDYLEAIYMIEEEHSVARVKDIANRLDVSSPSVSGAVGSLKKMGLVEHTSYGYIKLSDKGKAKAVEIYRIHKTLTDFIHRVLGIDIEKAESDACQIEHVLDPDTVKRIASFLEFSVKPSPQCEGCAERFKQWRKEQKK